MKKHFLQSRREALSLSQSAAAAALGVHRSVYARWERGLRAVPQHWRERVATMLEIDAQHASLLEPPDAPARIPRALDSSRHPVRRPYPIGGSLDDVLRLGRTAPATFDRALRVAGESDVQRLVEGFARDTRHELLVVLKILAHGGRPLWTRPLRFGCPLLVLDDFRSEYGGDQMQWAVLWEGDNEHLVVFGQLRVKSVFGASLARVDFVVHHKTRGRRGQWMTVELDGAHHATQPSQDEQRAESLLIPEIRYDNLKVLGDGWFARFLVDVRAASERGARTQAERDVKAARRRVEREAQIRLRLEQM